MEQKAKSVLTELYDRQGKLLKKKEELCSQLYQTKVQIKSTEIKLDKVNKSIDEINNRELYITAHAYSRYKSRIADISNEEIDKIVLTEGMRNMVKKLGSSGSYPFDTGIAVVCDNAVVTIVESYVPEPHKKLSSHGKRNPRTRSLKIEQDE